MLTDEIERNTRFLTFFTVTEPAIRAFVRSLVPTREDAREIMQDVAVVLWRRFEQCATEEDFRRWAFGVAKFSVLAWRRDKARDRLVLGEAAVELLAAQSAEMDERLDRQRQALERCVEKLPDKQRVLLAAAYAPGSRITQLAAASGYTVMAVYKTLHRLRLALVECTRRVLREEEPA